VSVEGNRKKGEGDAIEEDEGIATVDKGSEKGLVSIEKERCSRCERARDCDNRRDCRVGNKSELKSLDRILLLLSLVERFL
jgi:hypothetical protein